jgi:DNA-directed RNA polymerase subunit beta'
VVISEEDCGTLRGIATSALKDNEDIIEPLSDRIEGRTSLHSVYDPVSDELLVEAGEEITHDTAKAIEDAGIEIVEIRSVLTCESKRGVCVKCYGKNLASGYTTQRGDAVGIIAAQSIGEPGTQLTLRTFHVGGVAGSASVESTLLAKFEGTVQFDGLRTVAGTSPQGEKVQIVIGRTGEVRIMDEKNDRLLITNNIPYGSTLAVKNGQHIKKGDLLCSWDPFNNVIVAEQTGTLRFDGILGWYHLPRRIR